MQLVVVIVGSQLEQDEKRLSKCVRYTIYLRKMTISSVKDTIFYLFFVFNPSLLIYFQGPHACCPFLNA